MAVPGRVRAGLEGDQAAGSMRRCLSSEQGLNANRVGKNGRQAHSEEPVSRCAQ
jgi:hypothetical protein